jgi:hypothetical protein
LFSNLSWDRSLKGFGAYVSPQGTVSWILQKWSGLKAAFASYYAEATSLTVTFNEIRPEVLASGKVAIGLVMADRLDDPRVSRTADNPMGINSGYRGFQLNQSLEQ